MTELGRYADPWRVMADGSLVDNDSLPIKIDDAEILEFITDCVNKVMASDDYE